MLSVAGQIAEIARGGDGNLIQIEGSKNIPKNQSGSTSELGNHFAQVESFEQLDPLRVSVKFVDIAEPTVVNAASPEAGSLFYEYCGNLQLRRNITEEVMWSRSQICKG